jgi:hypothetical protein
MPRAHASVKSAELEDCHARLTAKANDYLRLARNSVENIAESNRPFVG